MPAQKYDEFVEKKLKECLEAFENETGELTDGLRTWLLNRFRGNFDTKLHMGTAKPENIWDGNKKWLKKRTKAMAHFALSFAISEGREQPIVQDLENAVEFIQHSCAGPDPEALGGWCSG